LTWPIPVLVPEPARHGENVVAPPMEGRSLNLRAAFTFEHAINRACGLAMRTRGLAGPQHLAPERHGRHNRSAGRRIDIFEDDPVVGASGIVAQAFQRGTSLLPTIDEQRRVLGRSAAMRDKQGLDPARAVKPLRMIVGLADRLQGLRNRGARVGPIVLFGVIEFELRRAGHAPFEAIVDATVRRARPILLTAAAAIFAMVPLSRNVFWGPMAVAIMGGLTVATFLTLFFLPALYAAWFRIRQPVHPVKSAEPSAALETAVVAMEAAQ
jgi:AcrB/AcrD/AcrF family